MKGEDGETEMAKVEVHLLVFAKTLPVTSMLDAAFENQSPKEHVNSLS